MRERDLPWELWDLTRPLGSDARLELLKFDADEAQDAFWRSSAHLLGAALESPLPLWGRSFARRRLENSARLVSWIAGCR